MTILALAADERVADVIVTEDELSVRLMDGRTISVPLAWYPRLLNATEAERNNWQIIGGGYGLHWEDLDEDLSTEGLLRGAPAPRQAKSMAQPSTRLGESHVSGKLDEQIGVEKTDEDEDEKGILDHLTEGEDASAELVSVLLWIDSETKTVAQKIGQHSSHLEQLNRKPASAKAADYKKIMLLAANDMNTFAKRVEGVLPNFGKSLQTLDESYTAYVSSAEPRSSQDMDQVINLRNQLSALLGAVGPAKENVIGFRDSTLSLKKQNISKELNKAASRQARALDGVISNIEQAETFALRINFLIDKIIEKPPPGR